MVAGSRRTDAPFRLPHDARDVLLLGSPIMGELRDLADAVDRMSQHLGWSAPDIDGDLTGAPGTVANSRSCWTTWRPASSAQIAP